MQIPVVVAIFNKLGLLNIPQGNTGFQNGLRVVNGDLIISIHATHLQGMPWTFLV